MNDEDMLPCPFCGETDIWVNREKGKRVVVCGDCGCTFHYKKSEKEWNCRSSILPVSIASMNEKLHDMQVLFQKISKEFCPDINEC